MGNVAKWKWIVTSHTGRVSDAACEEKALSLEARPGCGRWRDFEKPRREKRDDERIKGSVKPRFLNICGQPAPVLEYTRWDLEDEAVASHVEIHVRSRIRQFLIQRQGGDQNPFVLCGEDILVFNDVTVDRSTGFVVVMFAETMTRFLRQHFPAAQLTPALVRLVSCYLGGCSLKDAARIEGKSVETCKTQARELRQRMTFSRAEDVSRVVGMRLVWLIASQIGDRRLGLVPVGRVSEGEILSC